jgi:TPR repeat protein
MQWYQKAAAQGNAGAENMIGWLYQFGLGVPRDYAAAAFWYQKAATQGSPSGEDNIGNLYEKGLGIPKSTATAIQWYQKAAAQGNDVSAQQVAKTALARLHAGGTP